MTCQEVMDYMQRQLDGDLDERETDILNKHTRHCPDCAAMMDRLRLLSDELASLPKVTPSFSLVDAIMPQLDKLDAQTQAPAATQPPAARRAAPAERRQSWLDRLPLKTISGVVAASIVAGLFILNYNEPAPMEHASEISNYNTSGNSEDGMSTMMGSGEDPGGAADQNAPGNGEALEELEHKDQAGDPTEPGESAAPAEEQPEDRPATEGGQSGNEGNAEQRVTSVEQPETPAAPPATRSTDKEAPPSEPLMNDSNPEQNAADNAANESETDSDTSAGIMSGGEDAPASGDGRAEQESAIAGPMAEMVPPMSFSDEMPSASDMARNYANADTIASPDGTMKASVQDHVLQIYGSDGMLIFESRKKPGSAISNVSWSSDSQTLAYELQDPSAGDQNKDGKSAGDAGDAMQRYVVHIKNGTETRQ
ncbi:zf-HC2 domain-containing protein [Paenibacillus sp. 1P07SE]|uniref:zf-HC2 domain-containing protein n=1 Tax=Paenibacillus sp. 1P07SE TaxID=3132209 RepID=UPI0039A4694F